MKYKFLIPIILLEIIYLISLISLVSSVKIDDANGGTIINSPNSATISIDINCGSGYALQNISNNEGQCVFMNSSGGGSGNLSGGGQDNQLAYWLNGQVKGIPLSNYDANSQEITYLIFNGTTFIASNSMQSPTVFTYNLINFDGVSWLKTEPYISTNLPDILIGDVNSPYVFGGKYLNISQNGVLTWNGNVSAQNYQMTSASGNKLLYTKSDGTIGEIDKVSWDGNNIYMDNGYGYLDLASGGAILIGNSADDYQWQLQHQNGNLTLAEILGFVKGYDTWFEIANKIHLYQDLHEDSKIYSSEYCNSTGTCKDLSQWGGSSGSLINLTNYAKTNESNTFRGNQSILNGSLTIGTLATSRGYFDINPVPTVDMNFIRIPNANGAFDENNYGFSAWYAYAYKNISGTIFYSLVNLTYYLEDGTNSGKYDLNITINPTVGVDGYKLVLEDSYFGYAQDYYINIPQSNSFINLNYSALTRINQNPMITTPRSPNIYIDSNGSIITEGNVKINGQLQTDNNEFIINKKVTVGDGVDGNGFSVRATDGNIVRVLDPTIDNGYNQSINFGSVGGTGTLRAHGKIIRMLDNFGGSEIGTFYPSLGIFNVTVNQQFGKAKNYDNFVLCYYSSGGTRGLVGHCTTAMNSTGGGCGCTAN